MRMRMRARAKEEGRISVHAGQIRSHPLATEWKGAKAGGIWLAEKEQIRLHPLAMLWMHIRAKAKAKAETNWSAKG